MIRWMAWRLHRRGLVGFSVAGLLVSFFYGIAFIQAAGKTAAEQAAFGRATMLVAKQFAFIIPVPVHPETLGGFEQYKWLSGATVMMAIWAGLAGVSVGRGDEDKGLVEQWLASGVSRTRLLISRSTAYLLVLFIACLASVLGICLVAPLVQQDPNVGGELAKALSMTVGLFGCYAIALFISQLPAERPTAMALGIGALVLLLVVNGIADTVDSASGIGIFSPFHWMEKTSSAAPGGTFDVPATAGLAVAAIFLIALTIPIFRRRDVGSGLFAWGRRTRAALRVASGNPLLRTPFSEGLWEQRVGLAIWAGGALGLAAIMVAVVKSIVDALFADPRVGALFMRAIPGPPYQAMLGFVWLSFTLLILAGYAVVQVSRWSTQDQEGRVEMLLSAPVSRSRVVIERAVEFALASLVIVAAGYLGVLAKLPSVGFSVDSGRVFLATALLWPFALAFGGLGVALTSSWPRVAVPLLAAFAFVEYFLGDLAPIFKAPDWVANLSVFHLYGNPLVGSASWSPAAWMLLVFVAGFATALILMRRRDVSGA
jgi:ABC-2 type transport system permease protein